MESQAEPRKQFKYICYKCDKPDSHFLYRCPERYLTGCPCCSGPHDWRDCPIVAQKRAVYHAAGISLDDADDNPPAEEVSEAEEDEPIEEVVRDLDSLAIAALSIPTMTWQTTCSASGTAARRLPVPSRMFDWPDRKGRLVYRCRLGNHCATCLFDSGANCSLVSKEWVDRYQIRFFPNTQTVTLAQGNKTESILGFTPPLELTLGTFRTNWPFFVLPHLSHDAILGTDFALRYRVTYDPYDWSLIILGDTKIQLPTILKSPSRRDQSPWRSHTLRHWRRRLSPQRNMNMRTRGKTPKYSETYLF